MKAALLPDRGVVKVTGETARGFLNGLLTSDMGRVAPGTARYAALLTPQGKIIADCMVTEAEDEDGGGFYLDCPRALAPELTTKLNFYKLRAKITVEDKSGALGVLTAWDGAGTTDAGLVYPDPRLSAMGLRIILPPETAVEAAADLGAELVDAAQYDAHRVALGVPQGGLDFVYGDAFPHEADMDQLGGVDFDKGCYVGQEIVSRMEHRGTARKRVVPVLYDDHAPMAGAPIVANQQDIGVMGSAIGGKGLALIRLDRAEEALAAGATLSAGNIPLRVGHSSWAKFPMPGRAKSS